MKTLVAPGVVLINTQPRFTAGIYNRSGKVFAPENIGSFDIPAGIVRSAIAWKLKNGVSYVYCTAPMDNDDIVRLGQILTNNPQQQIGTLYGGEFYNYGYRAQAVLKVPVP